MDLTIFKILYYVFGVVAIVCAIVRIGFAEASFYNREFYDKYCKLYAVINAATWICIIITGIAWFIYKTGGI